MASHPIDLHMLRDNFGTPEMRAVWDDAARLRAQLDVEAALARTQSAMGIIPADAGAAITTAAAAADYDIDAIAAEAARVKHSLMATINALQARSGEFGEFVHYGLTTQDVVDTGTVLQIKQGLAIIRRDTKAVAGALKQLATEHRDTVMVGRSHGMQALPTTFGFKVAVWLDECIRHHDRLAQIEPTILTGNLNGAVGTYSVLGEDGPEVERRTLERLGLHAPRISWQSARDRMSEYGAVLTLISSTLGKVGNELYNLMRSEINEVEEPFSPGKIGSTTMPHKRNPAALEGMASLTPPVQAAMGLLLRSMHTEHERDAMSWRAEWIALPELHLYLAAQLRTALAVLDGLVVKPDVMAENLNRYGGLLMSEHVMFQAGQVLGKQTAHHIVYEAAMAASEQHRPFLDCLAERPELERFGRDELAAWLEPSAYLGAAPSRVNAVVAAAEERGL